MTSKEWPVRRWHWLSGVINNADYEVIVELGVHKAQNAAFILDHCPTIESYVGVDLWRTTDDYPTDRLEDFRAAVGVADENIGVLSLLEMSTVGSAELFDDGVVDLVFIDADHSYEAVVADIEAWWPKVRDGGLLAGHDYGKAGVRRAVEGTFGERVKIVGIDNCWYVEK